MRGIILWLGLVLAGLVLIFHIIHVAPDYEFVFLTVAVILLGLGAAPWLAG